MTRLGAHVSIADGVQHAPQRGVDLGCTAIQIFTRNQRQWRAKPLTEQEITQFKINLKEQGFTPPAICAHDSYLINLAAPDPSLLSKSREAFADELHRAEILGIPCVVFHPGAHKGHGETAGLKRIAESLDYVYDKFPQTSVLALLETTSGQGTTLGYRFEQLQQIIEMVAIPQKIGICLDTCHIFAAGYDIRTESAYLNTFEQFDRILGLSKLKVIHLNDSKKAFGSRVDRHENIGKGMIGLDAFRFIMHDDRLNGIPKILETPGGDEWYTINLDILRKL